jgi:hypothetical protein
VEAWKPIGEVVGEAVARVTFRQVMARARAAHNHPLFAAARSAVERMNRPSK